MLKLVHDGSESAVPGGPAAGSSLLDEIVRDGARRMLAAALQAEVTAYVDQFVDEVDENGHRLVVRNGYHEPREVVTAAGAVPHLVALVRAGADKGRIVERPDDQPDHESGDDAQAA
jgi:putative transposase